MFAIRIADSAFQRGPRADGLDWSVPQEFNVNAAMNTPICSLGTEAINDARKRSWGFESRTGLAHSVRFGWEHLRRRENRSFVRSSSQRAAGCVRESGR